VSNESVAVREVIRKVIEAEGEAKRLVEAAKVQAEGIVSKMRTQCQDLLLRADGQGRAEARKIIESAVREAEQEKQERLRQAVIELDTQLRIDAATVQCAVDGVVRCVCRQS
jgi:vacuolar-type H+-ATPase subunit H